MTGMGRLRKLSKLLLLVLFVQILISWPTTTISFPSSILQYVGLGELHSETLPNIPDEGYHNINEHRHWDGDDDLLLSGVDAKFNVRNFSMALVMSKMKDASVEWLDNSELKHVAKFIYSPERESGYRRIPLNKGREAMTYLTYMIDEYYDLADVSVFMHSHQYAYHQPALLNDSVEILQRLNPGSVWSQGYMNLRCQTDPGCPAHIRPGMTVEDPQKEEEVLMARAFAELFPGEPIPLILAQPCCAQFALSRKAIRAVPREELIRHRQWLIDVKIRDSMSGRIFEFLWHYIFSKQPVLCPDQVLCYCESYGLCFEDEQELKQVLVLLKERQELAWRIEILQSLPNVQVTDVDIWLWESQLAERKRRIASIKANALLRAVG